MAQQVLSQHATTRARDDPSSTAVHGVLAVVGYNRRRAVALEFEVDRIDDSRHANVVVVRVFFFALCACVVVVVLFSWWWCCVQVPSTLHAGVERRFRLHVSGRPSAPALAPCVAWPSEARCAGEWTRHTAGGGRDSPLWRANTQYRITGVAQPVLVRVLVQLETSDASADSVSLGVMIVRGPSTSRAALLDEETEIACSSYV